MAKKYPVLYTILVWIGIVAFGFTTFCGMYVLSFLPEIPASEVEERQMLIETGAMIAALGAAKSHLSRHVAVAQPRHGHRVFAALAETELDRPKIAKH